MTINKPGILFVSNFLSGHGYPPGVAEQLAGEFERRGWRVLRTSNKLSRSVRLLDMLRTIVKYRHDYHIAQVDVFSWKAFIWAEACVYFLKRLNKPVIITLHGGNLPEFAIKWPKRVNKILKTADVVTAPSPYLYEAMKKYRSDIQVIPNPIDIELYPFRLRSNPEPNLIWLRAFHRIYNPMLAPKVVARLVDEFPDIHLMMIGPDKGDGSLEATRRIARELGVLDRIEFVGGVPKEKVPEWLNRGDIFINTTNIDNTPVSVIEAMACGLCVVTTNAGGISYLLNHERNALIVRPDDAEVMARAIQKVLRDPGLAKTLSEKARDKAEHFSLSRVLSEWERLIEVLLNGRS